jgi:hypothetical protein
MDNSAFEMYKQQRPMYPTSKLIELATEVNADCIVMSDYPGEPGQKTIDAAEATISEYKTAGFDTFFVPQSEVGNLSDYMNTLKWALGNKDIDLIGLSILGCPNAFGVERDNKLQRFLSRWKIFQILDAEGLLGDDNINRFHMLGMVDGPNEISILKDYHKFIRSWDSSAAIWAGLHNVSFDDSPTGLVDGKFEKEVNFGIEYDTAKYNQLKADINVSHIQRLLGEPVYGQ